MWDVVNNPDETLKFDCRYNHIAAWDRDQFESILAGWKEQITRILEGYKKLDIEEWNE